MNNQPTTSSPYCSRRLLQFSLRTLLLATLVVAVFFGGRESGRRLLEAERRRSEVAQKAADAARCRAEVALAESRLKVLDQQLALARLQLMRAEAERDQNALLIEKLQSELDQNDRTRELLDQEGQRLLDESRRLERSWLSRKSRSRFPNDFNQPPTRAMPINEYWQRKKLPAGFPDSPRLRTPLPTVS